MSEKIETLQVEILKEIGNKGLKEIEIPTYITQNISKELREYQIDALKFYLANSQTFNKNHLMFNMATGSGKTLIMAALMLDCYARGYRDFIFFVDKTMIVEKTKANFAEADSSKYLFAQEINVSGKRVKINIMNNLNEGESEAINIHFTTIHSLFSLLTNERENAITFSDLVDKKLVFLADEAHHLNADTKKEKDLKSGEKELKKSWEGVIKKAFASNKDNLMLEFTATIPKDKAVQEKYRDKIIFEYDLAKFCKAGYSKRIFLLKYDDNAIDTRFLGGILMSYYRELVALKNGFYLKPVILFKSETIAKSRENERLFIEFISDLNGENIREFFSRLDLHKNGFLSGLDFNKNELLSSGAAFFKAKWGEKFCDKLAIHLKEAFKKEFILNTNDEKEVEKHQILLNSLEERTNDIRVIFAVDKLNEGWDVLNLFDIVRLGEAKSSAAVTTQEAQLIGRGARYCPFETKSFFNEEMRFLRKFDNDASSALGALERLTYHALNDVEFIKKLNQSMIESGLLIEETTRKITLKPHQKIKEKLQNERVFYAKNERTKKLGGLFADMARIGQELREIKIPLFSFEISQKEIDFEAIKAQDDFFVPKNLGEFMDKRIFLKAMNIEQIYFNDIKNDYEKKSDFVKFIYDLRLLFHRKQDFTNRQTQLKIAQFVLKNFKILLQKMHNEYEVSAFKIDELSFNEREFFTSKIDKIKDISEFDFLLFHNESVLDSGLEREFLQFIQARKERLDSAFEKWFVVRNEGFSEFKIYDNRLGEMSYAKGFEPDFMLFAKRRGEAGFFGMQCFIESKGEHLAGNSENRGIDAWKETFLESLNGRECDLATFGNRDFVAKYHLKHKKITLKSLPFFKSANDEGFEAAFERLLKG